jgi:TonB family protein
MKPTTRAQTAAEFAEAAAAAGVEAPALPVAPAEVGAKAVADAPLVETTKVATLVGSATGSSKPPMEFLAGYPQGVAQVSARAKVAVVLTFVSLFLIAFTLGGIYVYRSLHPKTIYDYSEFKPAVPSVSQTPDSQVVVPVPEPSQVNTNSHAARSAQGGAKVTGRSKSSAVAPRGPAASVWPPSNQGARDAVVQDAASGPDPAAGHRTAPVHVEPTSNGSSTTIVAFAPKPAHADANGISGTVMVEVSISKQGNVTNARVISGPQALRSAALQTVQQWKFKPYMVDGAPAEVTTTLGVYVKGD